MSSLFRRKLDELESMFIASQDDLLARFEKTYAENARLKDEVERLTQELKDEKSANANVEGRMQSANLSLSMANHNLKAEVERLRAASFVTAVPVEQYERVVKAGDALYDSEIGYYGEQILMDMKHHSGELCRNWNAAKEGKPSV